LRRLIAMTIDLFSNLRKIEFLERANGCNLSAHLV
jgi:hypothetical protein